MNDYKAIREAGELRNRMLEATSRDEVAEIMRGASMSAFILLDERPGLLTGFSWSEDWTAWLRQLRNDPQSDMLDNLTR